MNSDPNNNPSPIEPNGPQAAPTNVPPTPVAPMQPPTQPGGKGKANIGLIVGIIITVVIVAAGAFAAFAMLGGDNSDDKKSSTGTNSSEQKNDTTQSDEDLRAANASTATSSYNFETLCDTGSILNSADYKKPYKIVAFSKSSVSRSWSNVTLAYDADYAFDHDDIEAINVVACLTEVADSAVKGKVCEFRSSGEIVAVDYYAVKYNLDLYEAKTGKKIDNLGVINGPASTCPSFVSYDPNDPKIHASPDRNAVDAALARFAA